MMLLTHAEPVSVDHYYQFITALSRWAPFNIFLTPTAPTHWSETGFFRGPKILHTCILLSSNRLGSNL